MTEDEQVQQVIAVLAMPGWNNVMLPTYANRAKTAMAALTLSPSERKTKGGELKDFVDEDLRAMIRECEFQINLWVNVVRNYQTNRVRDELAQRQNGADSPLIPMANP